MGVMNIGLISKISLILKKCFLLVEKLRNSDFVHFLEDGPKWNFFFEINPAFHCSWYYLCTWYVDNVTKKLLFIFFSFLLSSCPNCEDLHAQRCEGSARMYGLNILAYDTTFPGLPNRTSGKKHFFSQ